MESSDSSEHRAEKIYDVAYESFLGEWRVVGGRYVGGKRKAVMVFHNLHNAHAHRQMAGVESWVQS
eukprot:scaffold2703_cov375-Chaetoceros_neogracile.AAC.1